MTNVVVSSFRAYLPLYERDDVVVVSISGINTTQIPFGLPMSHVRRPTTTTMNMYRPQHTKRRSTSPEDSDDDASITLTPTTTATAQHPTAVSMSSPSADHNNKTARRRSTVDTPCNLDAKTHNNNPHSQSEPNRKSWAETDWEELEKLWNSNHNSRDLSDRGTDLEGFMDLKNAVDNNTTGDNDSLEHDLFVQFYRKRFEQEGQLKQPSVVDGGSVQRPRLKPWRRRVTI